MGARAKDLAAVETRRCDGPAIAALVRAARSGDSEAFGALYRVYRREVRATVKSVLRDDNDADEALQQAFLQAWRGLAAFDSTRGSFAAWLNRIATNHAYDLRRARARCDLAGDDAVAALCGRSVPRDLVADEAFQACLRLLSKDQRAVIVLRFQFDWSIAEVADQLGSTCDAVTKLQRRALDRLRAARTPHRDTRPSDLRAVDPAPAPMVALAEAPAR